MLVKRYVRFLSIAMSTNISQVVLTSITQGLSERERTTDGEVQWCSRRQREEERAQEKRR